jgi:hypothetical protein
VTWTVLLGLHDHPWVLPTALLSWLVVGVAFAVVRARRRRRGRPAPSLWAAVLWCAVGAFAAVTLTPSRIGLGLDPDTMRTHECLLTWPRTGFGLWARNPERRWNVLIGVPLGFAAAAWTWRSRRVRGRPHRAWAPVGALVALAVPELVEAVQVALPGLGRQCAVVDVVDNLSGVLMGAVAAVAGGLAGAAVRTER